MVLMEAKPWNQEPVVWGATEGRAKTAEALRYEGLRPKTPPQITLKDQPTRGGETCNTNQTRENEREERRGGE